MAAIDIEKEYKSLQALFGNVEEPYDEMIKVACNFLADFAKRVSWEQKKLDQEYLDRIGFYGSENILRDAPLIKINKGDVK